MDEDSSWPLGYFRLAADTDRTEDDPRCIICGEFLDLVYEREETEGGIFWIWICPACGTEHGEGVA